MRVRPAQLEDVDAVVRLRSQLFPATPSEQHTREVRATVVGAPLSTLALAIFVAESDGDLVGFIEVGLRSHADGCDPMRPIGYVEGWFVRPDLTRKGIGRDLMRRAELWCREQGCAEIASDTWLDNTAGQRAHEAAGFEVVDRCVNYRKSLS